MGCGSCASYAVGQTLARSECIEGMTVRDRWSCDAFARCTAGHWEWRQCTAPLLWSVIKQSCVTDSECEPSVYGPVEYNNQLVRYLFRNLFAMAGKFFCASGCTAAIPAVVPYGQDVLKSSSNIQCYKRRTN
uniref:Chitin-binding type-2 domain-containing protein n=1 Tax=Ascaris lumbricoides TaxID=6252 RepID=A0A0M3HQ75_ASCLU